MSDQMTVVDAYARAFARVGYASESIAARKLVKERLSERDEAVVRLAHDLAGDWKERADRAEALLRRVGAAIFDGSIDFPDVEKALTDDIEDALRPREALTDE